MNTLSQQFTKPFYIFFLVLPSGISSGFINIVLPFLLSKNGFPVAVTADIVAIGVSANIWRFIWGPIVDISFSMRKWYWISLIAAIISLLLLCNTPFTVKDTGLLSIMVFIAEATATLILLPVNNLMANRIQENKRGRASGWFQAGDLAGTGLGGGIGLWLAVNYSVNISGWVLCAVSGMLAAVILLVKDISHQNKEKTFLHQIKEMGKDIFALVKVPVSLFVIILLLMPIGTGAAASLWSAIAQDWKTDADTVILITGLFSGLVSAAGCVAGGVITDKYGVWMAYFGCGILSALVTFIMAVLPLQPAVYIGGVLTYAFTMGMAYTAFAAVILLAVGKKHVATKFSLLASLGNLPVVFIIAVNGRIHDTFNSKFMLIFEAAVGVLSVIIFYFILRRLINMKLISPTLK